MLNTERLCLGCMNDCGEEKICSVCGYDSKTLNPSNTLSTRQWLNGRYLIGRVLNVDEEAITYIAWDNQKDIVVNIREYFPNGISVRNSDKTVSAKPDNKFLYNGGLLSFIETSQKLIGLDYASLVPIFECFEENGTAYSVYSVFTGITLSDFIERNGGTLEWEQVRPLFLTFMDTLNAIHELGIVHGNISVDSIMVGRDGKLRLSPFFVNKALAAQINLINSGFSALEQYDLDNYYITPATDVYALSAVLFRVLMGNTPLASDLRVENDSLSIPAKFAQKLPRNVLIALANGLQVSLENRTKNIENFRNEIVYGDAADGTALNTAKAKQNEENISENSKFSKLNKDNSSTKYAVISALCTAAFFIIVVGVLCLTVFKDVVFPQKPQTNNNSSIESSIPSSQVMGSVDEGAEIAPKEHTVPDLRNLYYHDVIDNILNKSEIFTVVVKDKVFSDKYPKGTICDQNITPGTDVTNKTEISVTLSLGPQNVAVPNLLGLSREAAELRLLREGFQFIEFVDMYDSEKEPGAVLQQEPSFGTKTVTDIKIRVYINNYTGEDESSLYENSDY